VRGAGRLLRDRVVASPTLAEVSGWWRDQAEEVLIEAETDGLLLAAADPGWVADEVVAGFAGGATVSEASDGACLWDLMNEFWAGFLPLIATPEWSPPVDGASLAAAASSRRGWVPRTSTVSRSMA
jgi:hypothetical protein